MHSTKNLEYKLFVYSTIAFDIPYIPYPYQLTTKYHYAVSRLLSNIFIEFNSPDVIMELLTGKKYILFLVSFGTIEPVRNPRF